MENKIAQHINGPLTKLTRSFLILWKEEGEPEEAKETADMEEKVWTVNT